MKLPLWIEREVAGLLGPVYAGSAWVSASLFLIASTAAFAMALAIVTTEPPWGVMAWAGLAIGGSAAAFLLFVIYRMASRQARS